MAWTSLDGDFKDALNLLELDSPLAWTGLLESDDRGVVQDAMLALGLLEVDAPSVTARIDGAQRLFRAARGIGASWGRAFANMSSVQVTLDMDFENKRQRCEEQHAAYARAQAAHAFDLPTEWRGKRYRRREAAGDAAGREKAEEADRKRWGREVLRILLETDLPFAKELKERGLGYDSLEAISCLRALRANTLRKRAKDLGPLTRYQVAHGKSYFPSQASEVMAYFSALRDGQAARTAYGAALAALRFFEEAGRRPRADCLHLLSFLQGAAKELAAARAQETAGVGRQAKRQAPPMPVALVGALELVVRDEGRPAFHRFYAWYRLLRHWCGLRFHDTGALPSCSLERRARGLYGVLFRTKTSGPDREMSVLPIYCSQEAYVGKPWLDIGLQVLKANFGYERDYLLCLPNPSLTDTVQKRATYSDSQCFSRALFGSLEVEGGGRLLLEDALSFWTEHSDRAGLDSWLAALNVGPGLGAFAGRWAAHGAQDAYVRTAVRVVENLQRTAARHARDLAQGGCDHFGEEHLGRQLVNFLVAAGVQVEAAAAQADRLKLANYDLPLEPLAPICGETGAMAAIAPSAAVTPLTELDAMTPEALAAQEAAEAQEEAASRPDPLLDEDPGLAPEELTGLREPDAKPRPMGFVVSKTRRGRFRRLHFVGGCWRVPGEHYQEFDDFGQTCPAPGEFHARCADCFPVGKAVPAARSADDDVEDGLSSDTSSDSEESSSATPVGEGAGADSAH